MLDVARRQPVPRLARHGRYHTYLCDEVVLWVDVEYRTLAAREHRGIAGKSSGGYGAMITPMLRPDLFGALATHAGESYSADPDGTVQLPFDPATGRLLDAVERLTP